MEKYMFDFHIKTKIDWRMAWRNHSKRVSLFFRPGLNLMITKPTSISLLFCT